MKHARYSLLLLLIHVGALQVAAEEAPLSAKQVVEKMAVMADEMDQAVEEWGYWQESVEQNLDGKDRVEEEKKKLRRSTWLEGKQYMELVKLNDTDPDAKSQKEEAERKAEFLKELHDPKEEDSEDEEVTWKQLIQKYDYAMLPSDGQSTYLVSFRPRKSGVAERNRPDKILNNLTGKLWIDEDFHLNRVAASLSRGLKFGLGLVGQIDKLEIDYRWQQHENVRLPSSLDLQINARFLVFKSARQKVNIRYFDPFPRPDEATK